MECGPDLPLWFRLMEQGIPRLAQRDPDRQAEMEMIANGPWTPGEYLQVGDLPFPEARDILDNIKAASYDVILIDHLAAMDTSRAFHERQVFGKLVRELKVVAEDREVPVILLHQMGRGERQRAEFYRPPKLDDLYGSSLIEHTASIVLGIYRTLTEEGRAMLSEYNRGGNIPIWKHERGMGVHVLKARSGCRRYDLHLLPVKNELGHRTDRLEDDDTEYDAVNPSDVLRTKQP